MAEELLHDVFPAEVYLSDQRLLTKCRAFVTNERVIVWQNDGRGLHVEVEFEHTGVIEAASGRIEVFGLTRNALINKGRGCGCDSKGLALKALPTPASRAVTMSAAR